MVANKNAVTENAVTDATGAYYRASATPAADRLTCGRHNQQRFPLEFVRPSHRRGNDRDVPDPAADRSPRHTQPVAVVLANAAATVPQAVKEGAPACSRRERWF